MKKMVIIIGGGFGGLQAAKFLGKYPETFDVVVFDRRNYHLFQPLLYQVATAGLSPADIATPIRAALSQYKNISVRMEEIKKIDAQNKTVSSDQALFKYDYLIAACGAGHSYFGKDHWEEFAPGLKTLEMATEIRRRILCAFEAAEKEALEENQQKYLNFIVVGGGPTGVEMAGAIAEISRQTMNRDFRRLNPEKTRIFLVEAGARILNSFHPSLSQSAETDLKSLGVEVLTNTLVTDINAEGAKLKNQNEEKFVVAQTIVWAAGVKPSPLNATFGTSLDQGGRLIVNQDLSVAHFPHTFAVGDQVHFELSPQKVLPGLAPIAIQQGRRAAENILRLQQGKKTKNFTYLDKGQMATIGRKLAVMEFHGFKARGLFAWLAWMFVHIYYLIGFKSRTLVMIQWAWSYMTFARGARLITKKDWHENS